MISKINSIIVNSYNKIPYSKNTIACAIAILFTAAAAATLFYRKFSKGPVDSTSKKVVFPKAVFGTSPDLVQAAAQRALEQVFPEETAKKELVVMVYSVGNRPEDESNINVIKKVFSENRHLLPHGARVIHLVKTTSDPGAIFDITTLSNLEDEFKEDPNNPAVELELFNASLNPNEQYQYTFFGAEESFTDLIPLFERIKADLSH